ncbi:hypothetical protein ACIPY2_18720 [Paenarthrobacter sp. NPDC089675]
MADAGNTEQRTDSKQVFEKGLTSAAYVQPRVVVPASTEPKPAPASPKK